MGVTISSIALDVLVIYLPKPGQQPSALKSGMLHSIDEGRRFFSLNVSKVVFMRYRIIFKLLSFLSSSRLTTVDSSVSVC